MVRGMFMVKYGEVGAVEMEVHGCDGGVFGEAVLVSIHWPKLC